jgi:predicted Zn-dependent protease
VSMLRKIHNINRYRVGYIPPYLLTHPGPDVRMSYIQDLTLFSTKKQYEQTDEFLFQRFKSRIICLTKDPIELIQFYQNNITSLDPASVQAATANYILSQAYLAASDYENAETALRKTMGFYPDKPILKADLGVLYLKSGRFEEALDLLEEVKKAERGNAYATFYLAMTLEKTGRVQAASDLYEELLVTISDYAKLYYQLANVKASLGQQGEGFYYYGYYYWYEGDLKNAQYHFSKAVTLLPPESYLKTNADVMLKKIVQFEKEK